MELMTTRDKWMLLGYHIAVLVLVGWVAHSVNERRGAEHWAMVYSPDGQGMVSKQVPPSQDAKPGATATDTQVKAPQDTDSAPGHYDPIVILVVLAGTIGGALHGLSSLVQHAGQGRLYKSWWLFYVSRPFVGGAMGVVMYLILRSGLAGVQVQSNNGAYSLLAWSALAGLFSAPAMRKLRDVFEAIFQSSERPASAPRTTTTATEPKSNVVHITPGAPSSPGGSTGSSGSGTGTGSGTAATGTDPKK